MSDDNAKFAELCKLPYKRQALWFLNGYWNDVVNPDTATTIWNWTREFVRLENLSTNPRGEEGNELDQFWSAKFLEDNDVAMTQNARKEALRSIDVDHNGRMSLIEYLIWKFKKSVADCANAPQGSLTPEQQRELDECQDALVRLGEALERLRQAEVDLKAEQEELKSTQVQLAEKQKELDATIASLKALEAEQQAAVEAFEAEERKYKAECDRLRTLSTDQGVSALQRSKASVQLQALLAEDPLPLRKAKITQEAVVRRVQKEQAPLLASLASQKAEVAERQAAVAAQEEKVVAQKEQVVQEQQAVSNQMDEARARIDKLKSMGGIARGNIWWMEREMFEADKSLARAKQKYDHSKPFYFDPN
eukprot:CAMPEP_0177645824 /NCGR_PEP_ID=MMETSP0447-20121125/9453_1 /TAXON_ID=0 /ORGANISM="Stygamoeba regulata, Strain BSH-02190019" /LENGTH=363 /DNA_ID=CAMNT_0019148329 /DNA_START=81 /DNA_END=1172 /DNA_ORIENTATION=-